MENRDFLILNQTDFQKISSLLGVATPNIAELLEDELARAQVVEDSDVPTDVVTMNAKVAYVDLETQKESVITLVYPYEADIDEGKISVLTPLGSALIGLRVGQKIEWPFPNGKRKALLIKNVWK